MFIFLDGETFKSAKIKPISSYTFGLRRAVLETDIGL